MQARPLLVATIVALAGCKPSPVAQYARAIEYHADSVIRVWDSDTVSFQDAALARKARDFAAVSPPPEFANLHPQLNAPIQRLADWRGLLRQQLADELDRYLEARARAARMLSDAGVRLAPPPPTQSLLAYWRRP